MYRYSTVYTCIECRTDSEYATVGHDRILKKNYINGIEKHHQAVMLDDSLSSPIICGDMLVIKNFIQCIVQHGLPNQKLGFIDQKKDPTWHQMAFHMPVVHRLFTRTRFGFPMCLNDQCLLSFQSILEHGMALHYNARWLAAKPGPKTLQATCWKGGA
jgi:hypothetical protein